MFPFGKPQKIYFNGRSIKALTPPSLFFFKVIKKVFFFPNGLPLTPPPLNGTAVRKNIFFGSFPFRPSIFFELAQVSVFFLICSNSLVYQRRAFFHSTEAPLHTTKSWSPNGPFLQLWHNMRSFYQVWHNMRPFSALGGQTSRRPPHSRHFSRPDSSNHRPDQIHPIIDQTRFIQSTGKPQISPFLNTQRFESEIQLFYI